MYDLWYKKGICKIYSKHMQMLSFQCAWNFATLNEYKHGGKESQILIKTFLDILGYLSMQNISSNIYLRPVIQTKMQQSCVLKFLTCFSLPTAWMAVWSSIKSMSINLRICKAAAHQFRPYFNTLSTHIYYLVTELRVWSLWISWFFLLSNWGCGLRDRWFPPLTSFCLFVIDATHCWHWKLDALSVVLNNIYG